MSNPRFARNPSTPMVDCSFTESGFFWKMTIRKHTFAKIDLIDAPGATVSSNNPGVVPNDDLVFKGKTGTTPTRTVEFFGLSKGFTFNSAEGGSLSDRLLFQIEVVELPGQKPTFISFDADSAALNASGTPVPYQLKSTKTVAGGPPETLFDSVPSGTAQVAISCHGQMQTNGNGVIMFIAGNVDRSNSSAVQCPSFLTKRTVTP